jgi:hypothetical protein
VLGCRERTGRAGVVASLVAMVFVAGCGGDNESASPKTLKPDLPPASDYKGFRLERTFAWDNPIDVVVDGIPLPESTEHSVAVGRFEDAGFEAGAGERLRGAKDEDASITIAQFGSDDQAREILRYVQKEGLKQPCSGVCSEAGAKFDVPGIPGARGVQQTPLKNLPPHGPPPFSAYGVVFTVGSKFYLVGSGGPPGAVKRDQVIEAARSLYNHVRS